jgi:polyisoprenyl-phosphate glycosyltransferase
VTAQLTAPGGSAPLPVPSRPGFSGSRPLISIVAAFFDEADTVDAFFRETEAAARSLECDVEYVCVNDGSRDRTFELLSRHVLRNSQIRIVNLARNFGKEAAISAGLAYARGDAVIVMDADLQDPPALIAAFFEKWRQGFDVVYGIRVRRKVDSLLKRATAHAFYWLFDRLTETRIPNGASDFRLLDRRVVESLLALPERNRFMKGLYAWVGFNQVGIDYVRGARAGGKSGWSYVRLLNFAVDALTSFSSMPLRLASVAGFVISLLGFLYAAFVIAKTLLFGADVPGYASLMVMIMFLGGVQLFCLGVLGEYVGRLYTEAKGRPLYIVADIVEAKLAAGRPTGAPRVTDATA